MRRSLRLLLLLVAFALHVRGVEAQTGHHASERVPYRVDSGWVTNTGTQVAAVHAFPVQVAGAAWLRLSFESVELPAGPDGAVLRITSLLDGHVQTLDRLAVEQWKRTSAYFNGDAVLVEIVAHPGAEASRVVLDEVTAGLLGPLASLCGIDDDREPSTDPRLARILPALCTGFLVDEGCGSCLLTAGHCAAELEVLQFNVPPSNGLGQIVHPGPEDQYAVDDLSVQTTGFASTAGSDWTFFGVFDNADTGARPFEVQGERFTLAAAPPFAAGQTIRVTGYGSRFEPPAYNHAQQTGVGPRLPALSVIQYQVDTTGGNSGSPVVLEESGHVIGIHSHGGCSDTAGNRATRITLAALATALANPTGICAQGPLGSVVAYGVDVGGANVGTLTSPAPPTVGQGLELEIDGLPGATSAVVWFSMQALELPLVGGVLLADATTAFHWQTIDGTAGELALTLAAPVQLCGIAVYAQAFALDPGQPAGIALTNGLEIRIGQ